MSNSSLTLKQSGLRWLWLALLVFIADITIKLIVMDKMGYGWANRIEVLPFFNLLYVHNYGAAFSFLSDQEGWQRWLFTGIAFVVTGMLAYWMRRLPATDKWNNIAYALIIGGAVGNVLIASCMVLWSIISIFIGVLTIGQRSIWRIARSVSVPR